MLSILYTSELRLIVQVLMTRLYGKPAPAYRILKSERWVGRQHRGGAHHARFMRPICQAFTGAVDCKFVL